MYTNLFMIVKYFLMNSFITTMEIIGDRVELLILY